MLRKVDSSEGAGLNGGGKGDVDEVLEEVGLTGGLPEPFLGFGIVVAFFRRIYLGKVTIGSSRPGGQYDAKIKNTRAPNALLLRSTATKQLQPCLRDDGGSEAKRALRHHRQSYRKSILLFIRKQ